MVKSKPSATGESARAERIAQIEAAMAETEAGVAEVIEQTVRDLRANYVEPEWVDERTAAGVEALLFEYEPTVTEEEISRLVYGDVMANHLEDVTQWLDGNAFESLRLGSEEATKGLII